MATYSVTEKKPPEPVLSGDTRVLSYDGTGSRTVGCGVVPGVRGMCRGAVYGARVMVWCTGTPATLGVSILGILAAQDSR